MGASSLQDTIIAIYTAAALGCSCAPSNDTKRIVTARKANRKPAVLLTDKLGELDSEDPVEDGFALFGLSLEPKL